MLVFLCPLLLSLSGSPGATDFAVGRRVPARFSLLSSTPIMLSEQVPLAARSTFDLKPKRPSALPVLYGSLGALQALDVYSTRRALRAGAREANPLLASAAGSSGTMLAVKAVSTATSIYFAERAWKKNRKGAVALMAVINGVTAAVVARNFRHAR